MANSGPQKAVASVVYSSRERARSTASSRIWSWSKASVPRISSIGAQNARCASEPASGIGELVRAQGM